MSVATLACGFEGGSATGGGSLSSGDVEMTATVVSGGSEAVFRLAILAAL